MTIAISFDFSAVDANAWTIFIVGYIIVFLVLISLYFLFRYLPKIINFKSIAKKEKSLNNKDNNINNSLTVDNTNNQEVYAAIATAVNLYLSDVHDEESLILTIDRDKGLNSPWSSKIYNT